MKLRPNKTFPHPVLWKSTDDYVKRQFQVTRTFSVKENDNPILSFQFELSENHIKELLEKNQATYTIEISCPTTFLRRVFHTTNQKDAFELNKGDLYRQVEVSAFVICTKKIHGYYSEEFHKEFNSQKFDILPGDVLATVDTETYDWDTECVKPLHSVFVLVANRATKAGMFEVDTEGDKIEIQMNPADKNRFDQMRQSREQKPTAMFVYFSVLAEVLRQMHAMQNEAIDKKWYRAIDYKITAMGKDLSSYSADRLFLLAQELLRKPLGHVLPTTE